MRRSLWWPLRRALLCGSAFACLCIASASQASDATLSFVTDPSWSAYSVTPGGDAGGLLGNAECICIPGGSCPCCWLGNAWQIPGACWVWRPGTAPATVPVDLEGVVLRKVIEVPGAPDYGVVYLAADDFAELRVNGVLVGSIGSVTDYGSAAGAQGSLRQFDVTAYLLPGHNEIVIRNQNGPGWYTGTSCSPCTFGQNPTAVLAGGSIGYNVVTSVEPRSWGRLKVIYR